MTQLVELTISEQPAGQSTPAGQAPLWARCLFSGAKEPCALRRLSVPCELQSWLVRLLQRHAPVLEELSVARMTSTVRKVTDAITWSTIRVRATDYSVYWYAWETLPLPSEGRLVIQILDKGEKTGAFDIKLPITDQVHDST